MRSNCFYPRLSMAFLKTWYGNLQVLGQLNEYSSNAIGQYHCYYNKDLQAAGIMDTQGNLIPNP